MDYAQDIRRIAQKTELKKGLSVIEERPEIPAKISPPAQAESSTGAIASPLTEQSRETETVRIFNDANPDEWVDIKRVNGTITFLDANGATVEMILTP